MGIFTPSLLGEMSLSRWTKEETREKLEESPFQPLKPLANLGGASKMMTLQTVIWRVNHRAFLIPLTHVHFF